MDVTGEHLSDAVYLLRRLSEACAELDHLAGWEAHNSLVEAQGYLAAIAVELSQRGDLELAITAALENCQQHVPRQSAELGRRHL